MPLEQRDKELSAIGSAIGCNCRPCVDHHIPKGREAGLSEAELAEAVAVARAVRDQGIGLLAPRIDELLGSGISASPAHVAEASRAYALVCLGASVGVNSHPLLERHIAAALELGLTATEVSAAIKMASFVQTRAGEITAEKAKHALDELVGATAHTAARS
jgi:4-carboxymuconolactone decarboxylase